MASAPAPQFEPNEAIIHPPLDCPPPSEVSHQAIAAEPNANESEGNTEPPTTPSPNTEYMGVVHLTRTWVQYGIFGFAVLCIVIGAVEALFGR